MRITEEPGTARDNVAFDFDGVLHEHAGYRSRFGTIDLSPITLAHSRGYAVTIMTCNDTWRIADVLRRAGYQAYDDSRMRHLFWDGGRSGTEVLVTGRKVSAVAYMDDKGFTATYGCDWSGLLDEVAERTAGRRLASR
jgi:hypothetical protein